MKIYVDDGQNEVAFVLPDKAFMFISDFDHRRPVEPFTFETNLDEKWAHRNEK